MLPSHRAVSTGSFVFDDRFRGGELITSIFQSSGRTATFTFASQASSLGSALL